LQVNGWNWRTSSEAKLVRLRKPKIACSPLYEDYRPKTNVILLHMGHTKGKTHMGGIEKRKKTKNLNVVNVLTVKE
jgi:hypothetical protein